MNILKHLKGSPHRRVVYPDPWARAEASTECPTRSATPRLLSPSTRRKQTEQCSQASVTASVLLICQSSHTTITNVLIWPDDLIKPSMAVYTAIPVLVGRGQRSVASLRLAWATHHSQANLGYTVSLYLGKTKTKQKPDEPIRKYTTERTKAYPYGAQAPPPTLNQLPLSPMYLSSSRKRYHTLFQIGHLCCS